MEKENLNLNNILNIYNKILNEIPEKYKKNYEKSLGLWEGFSLKDHTNIVVSRFIQNQEEIKKLLPTYFSEEDFIRLLTLHDIGKTSKPVLDLQKEEYKLRNEGKKDEENITKKARKNKEAEETLRIVNEILDDNLNNKIIKSILSNNYINNIFWDYDPKNTNGPSDEQINKTAEFFINEAKKLNIKTSDYLNILIPYFYCDANSYTSQALEYAQKNNFVNLKKEQFNEIVEKYKSKKPGYGIDSWFNPNKNGINFNINIQNTSKRLFNEIKKQLEESKK